MSIKFFLIGIMRKGQQLWLYIITKHNIISGTLVSYSSTSINWTDKIT